MPAWFFSWLGWITAGGIALSITVFLMLKNAAYRYVLRKMDETKESLERDRQALVLYHEMFGDDGVMPMAGEEAKTEEIIQKCRLLWGHSRTPVWLARLALQWQEHKNKGRF
jgi:hypothetical protein